MRKIDKIHLQILGIVCGTFITAVLCFSHYYTGINFYLISSIIIGILTLILIFIEPPGDENESR